MIGDGIAPFYFNINSTSGRIVVRNNLKTDRANFNYFVSYIQHHNPNCVNITAIMPLAAVFVNQFIRMN